MPRTYNEQMQALVGKYREAGGGWPAPTKVIAAWAIAIN